MFEIKTYVGSCDGGNVVRSLIMGGGNQTVVNHLALTVCTRVYP